MLRQSILFLGFFIFLLTSCEVEEKGEIQYYVSDNTASLNLPFSDAVIVDDMIYLSGNIGNKPGSLGFVEGGIRAEAKQVMENIRTVLEANGASMEDIIKCTVMIDDISEWGVFNEEYIKFFPKRKPARSAFGADGLALGAKVEVECMACLEKD